MDNKFTCENYVINKLIRAEEELETTQFNLEQLVKENWELEDKLQRVAEIAKKYGKVYGSSRVCFHLDLWSGFGDDEATEFDELVNILGIEIPEQQEDEENDAEE